MDRVAQGRAGNLGGPRLDPALPRAPHCPALQHCAFPTLPCVPKPCAGSLLAVLVVWGGSDGQTAAVRGRVSSSSSQLLLGRKGRRGGDLRAPP